MAINPDTLKLLLKRDGRTQSEIARHAKVSVKTLRRVLKGNNNPNKDTVSRLSTALGTEAHVLNGPPEKIIDSRASQLGYRRFSAFLRGDYFVRYELVEARYGVTQRGLIEAAPLLLTLLAEMSLADRRARLAAFEEVWGRLDGLAPQHLRGIHRGQADFEDARDSETSSIAASDISGSKIGSDEWSGDKYEDLFVSFLSKLAGDLDGSAIGFIFGGVNDVAYDVLQPDLARITHDDPLAEFALVGGYARLRDIPDELRGDDLGRERAAWLAARVPADARSKWEAEQFELLVPDDAEPGSRPGRPETDHE